MNISKYSHKSLHIFLFLGLDTGISPDKSLWATRILKLRQGLYCVLLYRTVMLCTNGNVVVEDAEYSVLSVNILTILNALWSISTQIPVN